VACTNKMCTCATMVNKLLERIYILFDTTSRRLDSQPWAIYFCDDYIHAIDDGKRRLFIIVDLYLGSTAGAEAAPLSSSTPN